MPLRGGRNWKRPGPYAAKIPGVLIRPDRGTAAPEPARYEWSSWTGASRRHWRLVNGRGFALCGRGPAWFVPEEEIRQEGEGKKLCGRCEAILTMRAAKRDAAGGKK